MGNFVTERFKPKIRAEAEIDLRGAIMHAVWTQFQRTDIFPFQNCLGCKRFVESEERCKFYNARPPARVIAFGCDEFEDINEIPF